MSRAAHGSVATNLPATNLVRRLLSGTNDPPKISREEAEAFLNANGRRAESLVAAWRASGDINYLREAMQKFPNDPRVAFLAWAESGAAENPADRDRLRREWLDQFRRAAPDNALADYLSARDHIKSGDKETALREIAAAANKPFRDYTLDQVQNVEEAYRTAGFSEAEAKAIAGCGALLPQLAPLKDLAYKIVDLSGTYRSAGDSASADAALQWAAHIGSRLDREGTATLLQDLVGVAIERYVWKSVDPSYIVGDSQLTAQQRIEALDRRREDIRQIARDSDKIMNSLSDAELVNYFDRSKLFGEAAAVQWAKARAAGRQ